MTAGNIAAGAAVSTHMKNTCIAALVFCTCATAQPVVQWNRELLSLLRTPGAQPATVHATRSLAILHAAIYDAVNSIDGSHAPYRIMLPNLPATTSQDAAADAAAHQVLVSLFPAFTATLDSFYQQQLAPIPDSADKSAGIQAGITVANDILALRANDGSGVTPPPLVFGTGPGAYQKTPPNFPNPVFTHWSGVTPFALQQANQFRPGPPPALSSQTYLNAFSEVETIGMQRSEAATTDQRIIGVFWNGAIQDYWNEIGQTAALAANLTTAQSARLFALLNFALADTVIAFYDAKYTYTFWRPVTAIRVSDPANPNWLPETVTTAADPSYPGAHGAISAAAATVLTAATGSDQFTFSVTSEVFAGVVRSFTSFSAASQEAFLSRIYAGQHFRFDQDAGSQLGTSVANFVLSTQLH